MKRRVRLTESDLHRLVDTSVRRIVNEIIGPYIDPDTYLDDADTEDEYDKREKYLKDMQSGAAKRAQREHPQRDDRGAARMTTHNWNRKEKKN